MPLALQFADVLGDVLNAAVGLIVGLMPGFIFERRATRAARSENSRLEHELQMVLESVYTVGGQPPVAAKPDISPPDFATELYTWLRERQDAEGRVLLARAFAEFVTRGHASGQIEDALTELSELGQLRRDGNWVRLR